MKAAVGLMRSLLAVAGVPLERNFPPGPRGIHLLRLFLRFQQDPLAGYTYLRRHWGHTCGLDGGRAVVFAFHPKDVEYVLKTNHKNYTKSDSYKELHPLLGQGLVTSEGELWRRQRQLLAKEFHPEGFAPYLSLMEQFTSQMIYRWQKWASDKIYFDLSEQMMALTFEIASATLFGQNLGEKADMVREALAEMSELAIRRMLQPVRWPYSFPFPSHRRVFKKLAQLDEMVFALMNGYAQNASSSGNVMAKLMNAPGMPRQLLRDEIMTLLMAGHETTSNALSWTFYLLAKHPQWQDQVRQEIVEVVSDQLSYERLLKLRLLKAVLQESMRLYPPVPVVSRSSIKEDQIGGLTIPAKTIVATVPYVTHRDPEFFMTPEKFMPERFFPENLGKIVPFSYFPFAAGPRRCIGEDFAMIESLLVLTKVLQNFSLKLRPDFVPQPAGHITLKSLNGVWIGLQ